MDPELGASTSGQSQRQGGNRYRRYCFTLNNFTEAEYDGICGWMHETEIGIVAIEKGASGTPHLQCYFRLKNAAPASSVRNYAGMSRAAIFSCKGTEQQNVTYCKKDGDYQEFNFKNYIEDTKARPTLADLSKSIVEQGVTALSSIIKDHPEKYVLHYNGFHRLLAATQKQRNLPDPPKVVYAWGDAGSGKSTLIHSMAEKEASDSGKSIYYWGAQWPWADGYMGEEIIVIDDIRDKDFRGTIIPINFITRIMDRFPAQVQVKGGTLQMLGTTFFMSSVLHPADLFNRDAHDPVEQFLRRITDVYKCFKEGSQFQSQRIGDGFVPRFTAPA